MHHSRPLSPPTSGVTAALPPLLMMPPLPAVVPSKKIFDSPVVRRAKKVGHLTATPDPKMRRSLSLNQVDVIHIPGSVTTRADTTEHLVDSCQQYLDENKKPATSGVVSEVDSADAIVVDRVDFVSGDHNGSSPYGTLPKVMKKNISRSLVPAMKRMFEKKASSVEPSSSDIRLRIPTSTPSRVRRSLSPALATTATSPKPTKKENVTDVVGESDSGSKSDGTESVSSFVALSVEEGGGGGQKKQERKDSASTNRSDWDDDFGEGSSSLCSSSTLERSGSVSKKGFVNKCMSKVKNMMNKGELE
jgi:hypothetical protein